MEEKIKDILEYYKREKINKETATKLLLNLHSVMHSDFFCHRECTDENKCVKQCLLCSDMEKNSV